MRSVVLGALGKIASPQALRSLFHVLRESPDSEGVSIGAEIVPTLEQGLGSANASVRQLACECLGPWGTAPPPVE
jgi:HEAT repeat protein